MFKHLIWYDENFKINWFCSLQNQKLNLVLHDLPVRIKNIQKAEHRTHFLIKKWMINREVQNLVYDIKMIPNQSKHLIQKYNIYLILDKILFRFPPNSYLTLLIQIGNSDITLRSPSNVKTNPFPMNFKWKELINVVFDKEHLHAAANHIVFSISIHGQNNQIISNGQLKINPCLFEKPEMQNNRPFFIDIPNSNSPLMIYTSIHLLPYQN